MGDIMHRMPTPFLIFLYAFALVLMFGGAGAAQTPARDELLKTYRSYAAPLQSTKDLAPLIEEARTKRLILLGESTHGTREFYTWRAEISRQLIESGGVSFVVVEGSWVPFLPLDDYVRHKIGGGDVSARSLLLQHKEWPRWMWANEEFADFVEWLRAFNTMRVPHKRVALYGMDLYATWDAKDAVTAWYAQHRPEKIDMISAYYAGFAAYRDNFPGYIRALQSGGDSAQHGLGAVADKLQSLWDQSSQSPEEYLFRAKQSAKVVRAAEEFYRTMLESDTISWNVRVHHMHDTVNRLLARHGAQSRGIVWAHNTHIGDARATAMSVSGEHNIGQLSRETHGEDQVMIIGFSAWHGTLQAGREWGAPRQAMAMRTPPKDSFEWVLKNLKMGDTILSFPALNQQPESLAHILGHRAIGVVYIPEADRMQYLPTIPAQRYDALIFLENTNPVSPLHETE